MFKLLILDIDGVMTNGTKTYDREGNVLSKSFNDRDWTAIKKFKAAKIPVVFLSGDPWNETIAKKRNIDFYCSKGENGLLDKARFASIFEKKYKVHRKDMAYVGDDFFDLDIMKLVGWIFCPMDGNSDVQRYVARQTNDNYPEDEHHWFYLCRHILDRKGGEGVIDSLFAVCEDKYNLKRPSEMDIRILDAVEK